MPLQIIPDDWTSPWGGGQPNSGPTNPQEPESIEPRTPNVAVEVISAADGIFKVTWNDIAGVGAPPSVVQRLFHLWRVIYASKGAAGNPANSFTTTFAVRVMNVGLQIYSIPVLNDGRLITYVHTDPDLGDGWIVVASLTTSGLLGRPSQPIYVRLETGVPDLPDEITGEELTLERLTVGGYQVWRFHPSYVSPADMTDFWGVQLYLNGFHQVDLEEISNAHPFPTNVGGERIPANSWEFDLPAGDKPGSSMGMGTATFTNGSTAVVRVSGDNFDAGMASRPIYIKEFDERDGTWTEAAINTFTDANNINLLANFTGTTGVYSWDVLPVIICYFVALNPIGQRTATPTSSPNRTI